MKIFSTQSERSKAGWTPERRAAQAARFRDPNYNPSVGRPKGSKNKKPYPKTEEVLNRRPPSWAGRKHSEETKIKISNSRKGIVYSEETILKMCVAAAKRVENGNRKNFMVYKGKFRPNFPEKYDGDPTNIIYRSSLELRFMQYLDSNSGVLKWQSEEFFIPYFDPATNRMRRYFPDFLVVVKQGDTTLTQLIEIKPASQTVPPKVPTKKTKRFIKETLTYGTNLSKWKHAEEYCKDRNWKFKIITDKDLKIY